MDNPNKEPLTKETHDNIILQLVKKTSGIAHLVFNDKSAAMNTLNEAVIQQIITILHDIQTDKKIIGLVIISGKKDVFIAGADINMLSACQTVESALNISRQGQRIFDQIEQLDIPVIAAIHGSCLGGGLELALACHQRICSDSDKTVLGLPEVQLGLLPGSGGTQRLPKLIGIQKSLDLMLTGKKIRAKQANKIGLVDSVVPVDILLITAEEMLLSKASSRATKPSNLLTKLLEGNALGRQILFNQVKKSVLVKTQGHYPAPLNIIDCVRAGMELSPAKAYQIEAELFAQLVFSKESIQLRHIFFATTAMKNQTKNDDVTPKKIQNITVLGGGLMGGGITYVSAINAKLPVRIKDISHQGICAALAYSYERLNTKVKRRFITKRESQKILNNISGTLDFSGLKNTDVVIEAVFEDLELKQKMVNDIESHCQPNVIFASNTSSLPIRYIAAHAQRPENVIGLHYFSPVDKMPLTEIIPHDKTSPQTISTIIELTKQQGKTAIVVKDTAGFYVNRILVPYMNEAANILLAGQKVEHIDKALVEFGFPVGPFQLLDEVGIDIGAKISPVLEKELGERFAVPTIFEKLIADGRLGKKVKKGFYLYDVKSDKKKAADNNVYRLLNIHLTTTVMPKLAKRCVYMMLNEAARCYAEGVISSPRDGDVGAIFGLGFPAFLGGPFRYIDSLGAEHVVQQLQQWADEIDPKFQPCDALLEMTKTDAKYY